MRRGQGEAGRAFLEVAQRFFEGQRLAATAQPPQQGVQNVRGPVADGEDFAGFLHLDGDALGLEQGDRVLDTEGGEGGMEEMARRPVGGTMPRLSVAWVTLQRVPPDMRILTPGLRSFPAAGPRRPRSAARTAATSPAAPAPTTTTSHIASGIWRFYTGGRTPRRPRGLA